MTSPALRETFNLAHDKVAVRMDVNSIWIEQEDRRRLPN